MTSKSEISEHENIMSSFMYKSYFNNETNFLKRKSKDIFIKDDKLGSSCLVICKHNIYCLGDNSYNSSSNQEFYTFHFPLTLILFIHMYVHVTFACPQLKLNMLIKSHAFRKLLHQESDITTLVCKFPFQYSLTRHI